MDNKLKIFIVDDSTVFRSQVRAAFDGVDWAEVVGFASNGKLAMDALTTKVVDVIVLDLEMPVMNGLEVLRQLKQQGNSAKVILFSSHSKAGAESTLLALAAGAIDFLTKPVLDSSSGKTPAELIRSMLIPKVAQFLTAPRAEQKPLPSIKPPSVASTFARANWDLFMPKVVVIASSTGGPNALEKLFSEITAPISCPILIAQHMPPLFTATFADRLGKVSGLAVEEAKHGSIISPGKVYVAPGDFHMRITSNGREKLIALDQEPQRNAVRPAADHLFESAAAHYGPQCLGIVLTGMGQDGRDGAIAVKKSNGAVMIQNKESCVVFGMPGSVFEAGAYDRIGTLSEIASQLAELRVCSPVDKAKAG